MRLYRNACQLFSQHSSVTGRGYSLQTFHFCGPCCPSCVGNEWMWQSANCSTPQWPHSCSSLTLSNFYEWRANCLLDLSWIDSLCQPSLCTLSWSRHNRREDTCTCMPRHQKTGDLIAAPASVLFRRVICIWDTVKQVSWLIWLDMQFSAPPACVLPHRL